MPYVQRVAASHEPSSVLQELEGDRRLRMSEQQVSSPVANGILSLCCVLCVCRSLFKPCCDLLSCCTDVMDGGILIKSSVFAQRQLQLVLLYFDFSFF